MLLRHFKALVLISAISFSCELSVSAQVLAPHVNVVTGVSPLQHPLQAVFTRDYDFSAAIAKYVEQSDLPDDQARRNAVVEIFAPFVGGSGIVKWEETSQDVFRVVGDANSHRQVEGVAQWMLHDFKQITIKTRVLTVSEATLKALHKQFGSRWKMSRVASDPIQPGQAVSQVVGQNALRSVSSTSPMTIQPASSTRMRDRLKTVASTASSTKSLPCRVAKLTSAQSDALVSRLQNDAQTNLMQTPTVTLFPGQDAAVKDVTSRPFVVSVKPAEGGKLMQPVIEVLEEGLTIDLRAALLANDRLAIDSGIRFNRIGNVDTFTFDTDEVSGTTVQIPEQHTKNVRLAAELKSGETLLVDPHFFAEETTKRRFRKDRVERKFTLILVTPHVIVQKAETVDGTKVAKL